MSELLSKAKQQVYYKQRADKFVARAKSLSGDEQEAFVAANEFAALENASFEAFLLLPELADYLRSEAPKRTKPKSGKQVSKVEQAIVKTFRDNPQLISTLDSLDAVAREGILGVLEKHLGEEDESHHDPTKGRKKGDVGTRQMDRDLDRQMDNLDFGREVKQWDVPMVVEGGPSNFTPQGTSQPLSLELRPGEASESMALFLRMPENLAQRIGDLGASVNKFFNEKSGSIGKAIWGVASDLGDSVLSGTPVGRAVELGRLIQQHGPTVLKGGLRNYYRFSGNERPIPTGLGSPGQGRAATKNAVIQRLKNNLPSEEAAKTSRKYVPSEGYIIDREGNVIAASIGRGGRVGDKPTDHYTPYALHQLKAVKGGTLVRRRMWGGPTEEDIRMALLLGADEITTISNTGDYTIRLTGENQGVNSELPLILSRFSELRGKGEGGSTHDVTDLALESLTAEFPIHFQQYKSDSDGHAKGDGKSFEEGLKGEGFLTAILSDWNKSLFGEDESSTSSGGGKKGTVDTSPPGTAGGPEKFEVGDKDARERATGPAKVRRPPPDRGDLKPVVRTTVDDHNAAEQAALADAMPQDALDDISAAMGGGDDFDARELAEEREQTIRYLSTREPRRMFEEFRDNREYFRQLGISPQDIQDIYEQSQ